MEPRLGIAAAPGRRWSSALRGRSLRPARALTVWALLAAVLGGAACWPVGAGAREAVAPHRCGLAEPALASDGPSASPRPERRGADRDEAPSEACLRHCRSADHALQSPAPKAFSPPLAPAVAPAPLAVASSREAFAREETGGASPPRASPRRLLHCSLLL